MLPIRMNEVVRGLIASVAAAALTIGTLVVTGTATFSNSISAPGQTISAGAVSVTGTASVTGLASLGGVSSTAGLYPTTNNANDLGGSSLSWQDVYASGTVYGGSGLVGSPGFAFGLDTDTGLYRIGSGDIGYVGNGAEVFRTSPLRNYSYVDLVPSSANARDLGYLAAPWRSIYVSSTAYMNDLNVRGAASPNVNNTHDIGTALLSWQDIYASGTLYGVDIRATNVTSSIFSSATTNTFTNSLGTMESLSRTSATTTLDTSDGKTCFKTKSAGGTVIYWTITGAGWTSSTNSCI